MAFLWPPERIGWYLDASAACDFHRTLAEWVRPHLLPGDSVCDLGCGLGRLDLLLAPHVRHITGVDVNEAVLDCLRRDAERAGLGNLSAVCRDVKDENGLYDVALMTFFGISPQGMLGYMRLARRLLIRVAHVRPELSLLHAGPPSYARESVQSIAAELDARGCAYTLREATLEFGQPLKSWADAHAFVRCNQPAATDAENTRFLRDRLTETGRADFPFYLPAPKEVGVFVIDTRQRTPLPQL